MRDDLRQMAESMYPRSVCGCGHPVWRHFDRMYDIDLHGRPLGVCLSVHDVPEIESACRNLVAAEMLKAFAGLVSEPPVGRAVLMASQYWPGRIQFMRYGASVADDRLCDSDGYLIARDTFLGNSFKRFNELDLGWGFEAKRLRHYLRRRIAVPVPAPDQLVLVDSVRFDRGFDRRYTMLTPAGLTEEDFDFDSNQFDDPIDLWSSIDEQYRQITRAMHSAFHLPPLPAIERIYEIPPLYGSNGLYA